MIKPAIVVLCVAACHGDRVSSSEFMLDAGPPAPWTTLTIYGPESVVGLNGADGVDVATIGGDLTVISPWEQSNKVTVSTRTGSSWSTQVLSATTGFLPEDAKLCDLDGDGALDVVTGGQGQRIRVWFGPAPFATTIELAAATNVQQWFSFACTPTGLWAGGRGTKVKTFTANALDDTLTKTAHAFVTTDWVKLSCVAPACTALPEPLVANVFYFVIRTGPDTYKLASTKDNAFAGAAIDLTTNGTGTQTAIRFASVGFLRHSGSPRVSSNWTWSPVQAVSLLISAISKDVDQDGDLDLVISDRFAHAGIKGASWLEKPAVGGLDTWIHRQIYASANEGEVKFLGLVGSDTVLIPIGGAYNSPPIPNLLYKSVTADNWQTWTTTAITPYPSGTGFAQAVVTCDLTGDGIDETVLTHAGAFGELLGVVAIDGSTGATIDIDRATGEKYDDVLCLDLDGDGDNDVLTSEQNGNTAVTPDTGNGVVGFINPRL